MLKRGALRTLIGIFIGVAGGISLTLTIFPYVTGKFFETPTFDLGPLISFAMPIVILWALGGGIVGWYGGVRIGGMAMGICGALAGFILSAFAVGGDAQFMWIGTLTGLLYGAPAGLMVGLAFPSSVSES